MKTDLTLERRVTLWSALVVAISLIICGGGGAWFLYHRAVAQLDRQLRHVGDQFIEQKRLHGGVNFDLRNQHEIVEWLPAPGAETVVEIQHNGTIYFRSPKLGEYQLPKDAARFRFVQLPLGKMRMGTITVDGITMRIATPVHILKELMSNLLVVFALGLPAMIALVMLGGRSIAREALEPVRRIADSAEQINSQQLDRRVPVPEPPDEIRRLALVLNATLDRLEASYHQAQRFSANASHELKTPLTTLHADLEALLVSPALSETDRAAVADALETTKRLAAMTTSLLLLARADAGRLELDLKPVDLVEIVNECLDDTRIIADASAMSVQAELPDRASVRADPTRLRQIVGNLLSNAVKYNESGGRIGLRLAANDRAWQLEITNTGPGIAPEMVPGIFNRFFRGGHHAQVPGHGLGLAISRELARAHKGDLELVHSRPAETVFRLTLVGAGPT